MRRCLLSSTAPGALEGANLWSGTVAALALVMGSKILLYFYIASL